MARRKSAATKFTQQLLKLRRKANHGDFVAAEKLTAIANNWAIRANKMLDRLESAGYTAHAYESAMTFITTAYGNDATRFSLTLKSPQSVYQQALALNRFLSLETSTIAGERRTEKRRIAAFREHFADSKYREYSGIVEKMSDSQIKDFFKFVHDSPVGEFLSNKSKYVSDGEDMDAFMYAIYGLGVEQDDVIQALNQYIDTRNAIEENRDIDDPFYYDDLLKYLKTGHSVYFKGKQVKV